MKKLVKVIVLLLLAASVYAATFYEVSVTRVSQDMYRDLYTKGYIQTRNCFQYAYNDEAVLVWHYRGSLDNMLVFSDGESCKVKEVVK